MDDSTALSSIIFLFDVVKDVTVDMIRVQTQTGAVLEIHKNVSGLWECPCPGFRHDGKCSHTDKAESYDSNKFYKYRFDVTSAFHKEVRRCDQKLGITWARIMKQTQGATRVRDYCRGILFEETRNIDLLKALYIKWSDIDRIDLANLIIRSRKRWMDIYGFDCLKQQIDGYVLSISEDFARDRIIHALHTNSLVEWYAALFAMSSSEEKDSLHDIFVRIVNDRINDKSIENIDEVKSVMELTDVGFHCKAAIAELATGNWCKNMNQYDEPIPDFKLGYIPRFEDYVFDCHSYSGVSRLTEKWFDIKPGHDMPEKIDMRWSGMLHGLLWRFEAYTQCSSRMKQFFDISFMCRWSDVRCRPDVWSNMKRLDAWFYKSFHRKAFEKNGRLDSVEYKNLLLDMKNHPKLTGEHKKENGG